MRGKTLYNTMKDLGEPTPTIQQPSLKKNPTRTPSGTPEKQRPTPTAPKKASQASRLSYHARKMVQIANDLQNQVESLEAAIDNILMIDNIPTHIFQNDFEEQTDYL